MTIGIIPLDTRYVPIPQQPYCCAAASLSMVMLRHGLPLQSQELIGYHLGLVVPTERKDDFWNARHAAQPVVASGFGSQISNEEFSMSKALAKLNIPLQFDYIGVDQLSTADEFAQAAHKIIANDGDVLVCLNWGCLTEKPEKNWGHVMCVDRIYGADVRLVDTDVGPKWRTFPNRKVFDAMVFHGRENYGGLWTFARI